MMNRISQLSVAAASLFLSAAAYCQVPMYRVTDIAKLPNSNIMIPHDLNNRGTVIGEAGGRIRYRDFLWTVNGGTRAGVLQSANGAETYLGFFVINDRGSIAANVASPSHSYPGILRKNQTVTPYLSGTWAEEQAQPIKIANNGDVLGITNLTAWLWSPTEGISPMMSGDGIRPRDVNNRHVVVGGQRGAGDAEFAFVFDATENVVKYIAPGPKPNDIDTAGWYSRAASINDGGQVVGVFTPRPYADPLPFVWSATEGLTELTGVGARQANIRPTDINADGRVVGRFNQASDLKDTFFYWDASTARVVDVKRLLDPSDPLADDVEFAGYDEINDPTQVYIPKINNQGQILLTGWLKSERAHFVNHTFLLTPVAQ